MFVLKLVLRRWPLFAFLASATMLAIAHAFETFGHLLPCHLCLEQRQVYWGAMGVAAVGMALTLTPWRRPGHRVIALLLTAVFAYGAYLAAFHAGAEWKWWPAPETCSGAGRASAKDLLALMHGAAAHPPACDKAAWVFLGLSMAGWNFLASLALIGLSLGAAARREDPE